MKHMKKIVALASVVACAATLFVGCGKVSEPSLYEKAESAHIYKTATAISEYTGYSVSEQSDSLILFSRSDSYNGGTEYRAYNFVKGTEVQALNSRSDSYNSYSYDVEDGFVVVTRTANGSVESKSLYSVNGGKSNSSEPYAKVEFDDLVGFDYSAFDSDNDGFKDTIRWGTDIYKVSTSGAITKAFSLENKKTNSALLKEPDIYAGGYSHYMVDGESSYGKNKILTFNDKYELVYAYPVYEGDITGLVCLDNGNYIVQRTIGLSQYAEDYTYENYNSRYNLVTELVDVEDGKIKEIKCEYLLEGGAPVSYYGNSGVVFDEDFSAIVSIEGKIVDKRVVEVGSPYFGITEKGDVVEPKTLIDNQNLSVSPVSLFGAYIAQDYAGRQFVIKEDGKVKEVNFGTTLGNIKYNAKYVEAANGKILNKSFNEVNIPDGYEVVYWLDSEIIIAQVDSYSGNTLGYALLNGGGNNIKYICNADSFVWKNNSAYYAVNNYGSSYTYYNGLGNELLSNASVNISNVVATSADGKVVVVRGYDNYSANYVYYVVK